jgi:chloramphenicol O-acetyltransferase type A
MKYIDMEKWPRRELFRFYSGLDSPHFNVCADVDLTKLFEYVKTNHRSTFKTVLYVACKAANAVTEFRLRLRGDRVVEHAVVHPSFTVLTDNNLFGFCEVEYTDAIDAFFERTQHGIEAAKTNPTLEDEPERDDYLFISSLPWIHFTSISHPINIHPTDSVPRISWGKYLTENGKVTMPLSVQVHHGLADGYHMGLFFNRIQKLLDEPAKLFDK